MSDESPDESRWLVAPVRPKEFTVRIGDQIDKSVGDRIKELVDLLNLPRQIKTSDTIGNSGSCTQVTCVLGPCKPFYVGPCRWHISCKVE